MSTAKEVIDEFEAVCMRTPYPMRAASHCTIRKALRVLEALEGERCALMPFEITNKMLTKTGVIDGWDEEHIDADKNHRDWYKAAIAARPDIDTLIGES